MSDYDIRISEYAQHHIRALPSLPDMIHDLPSGKLQQPGPCGLMCFHSPLGCTNRLCALTVVL